MTEIEKYHLKKESQLNPLFQNGYCQPNPTGCLNILDTKYPALMLSIAVDPAVTNRL
jgi:hypothetical protein